MQIDGFTILVSGLFVKALLAALFLAFWLTNRYATWFLWWSATFFFGTAATVMFVARGFDADGVAAERHAIEVGAQQVLVVQGRAQAHRPQRFAHLADEAGPHGVVKLGEEIRGFAHDVR